MFTYYIDAQLITSIAAVFIAALALGLTVWQGWMTRRHNYNSVRPILDFDRIYIPHKEEMGIYIKNCDLGPAIISDTNYVIETKR